MTQSDMIEYTITKAEPHHLAGIMEIESQSFSDPWGELTFLAQIIGEGRLTLVAEDNSTGRMLGFVCLMYVLDEGHISDLAIPPACRRLGVGDGLTRAVVEKAAGLGVRALMLEVRESNDGAVLLYEKHGFKAVGRRRGYYENPKEDALLMTLQLGDMLC